ncbi:MAG: ABC transporter ATP-binding protein [Candidatus Cryptobacteroides sp.]
MSINTEHIVSADMLSTGYGPAGITGESTFRISPGECVLLCGPNGSGKTTLLRTLAGLIPPVSGTLEMNCGAVFVPSRIPRVKGFTVREFVSMGLYRSSDWTGRVRGNAAARIEEVMESIGIAGFSGKDIMKLSDGEFQKACIASSLVQDAGLVLLDEPTAFLDVDARVEILKLLRDSSCGSRSVIFSSHDIADSVLTVTRVMGLGRSKSDSRAVLFDSGSNAGLDQRKDVLKHCFNVQSLYLDIR